jgi:hypothetical protein
VTGADRRAQRGRRGALLAVGAGVGAGLVLVGGPRLPAPGFGEDPTVTQAAPGPARPAALLDRSMLTTWCHQILDGGATAERIGGHWWCAGRPGGVWRVEEIIEDDACDANGWTGTWAPTDEGVSCSKGAR